MPVNPRSDSITLLRRVASSILEDLSLGQRVRLRANVVTGGQGYVDADFLDAQGKPDKNSDLGPADIVALLAALDALENTLKNPDGTPTPHLIALAKAAENPDLR